MAAAGPISGARPPAAAEDVTMPEITANQPRLTARPVTLALAAVIGALVAATLVLWAHYGTAVFFEIIQAGIAACF
jgi:hypothetical protein